MQLRGSLWRMPPLGLRRRRPRAVVGVAAAVALTAALVAGAAPWGQDAPTAIAADKVSVELTQLFEKSPGQPQEVWVRFAAGPDLTAAAGIDDWAARGEAVVKALQDTAAASQAGTAQMLKAQGVAFESYWISNAIAIQDGTPDLVSRLAERREVERLLAPHVYQTPRPVEETVDTVTPNAVEWGLTNINADDVWATGVNGAGIVIANVDTGVQFDHPALVNQYRGNNHDGTFSHDYNWFDSSGACLAAPCDRQGHGTHTMGTMVGSDGGDNQIGVAPGATWIAANGCDPCATANLLTAGQWMLAPTRIDGTGADPAKRPNIINNSWGTTKAGFDPFYNDVTTRWAASGIFGVWSNGNNGSGCETSGSPGSLTDNYSVGAYDESNTIADFSSRGSGLDGEVKPNIAAPGVNVRSAYPGGRYATANGTSMAAPHVAGAIALLWSAGPDLVGDLAATRQLLDLTARDAEDLQCGGTAADNNVFGEGRLDAAGLVSNRDVGRITGKVTDVSGAPIGDAAISVTGGAADYPVSRTVRSGADGSYQLALPAGQYDVAVTAYGYLPAQAQVSVTVDTTTTRDFALRAAAMATVSGRVTDGSGQGWPLYAALTISGYPKTVYTDPVTGTYSVELPQSADYTTQIDPVYDGYDTLTTTVTVGETDRTFDAALTANLETCTAPGYDWNGLSAGFTDWETPDPRDGWQVGGQGAGRWRFDNSRMRMQPPNGDGLFAIAEPAAADGRRVSTTLTSPQFDLSGQADPVLSVDLRYLGADRNSAKIEWSTDGRRWSALWTGGSEHYIGSPTFALPAAAAAKSVRVRFSFTGQGRDAYWAFDSLFVGTRECVTRPGGLLVGDVRDAASGNPVERANASLASAAGPDASSQRVPDPKHTGAVYWLFGAAGADKLTVSRDGYDRYTADVTIAPGAATRHDVDLVAAQN